MNGQKRFNEYFAKLILKYCYKDKYSNLQIVDKPDLRDMEHNIGIEVVYSMEQDRSESLFLQRQISCCADENRKVKLQKKLDTIHKKHKNYNYEYEYYGNFANGVEDTYLKEIFDCVRNKLDKLNKCLNYEELDSYELFINSAVPISEFGEQFDVLDKLEEINQGERKFDVIHVLAYYDLITFDMLNKQIERKKLYYFYERIGKAAEELINNPPLD